MKFNKVLAATFVWGVMTASQAATVNVATPGWNLLGYSDPSDVVVADAFGKASEVTSVWKWNAATSTWAFFSPALPGGGQAYALSKGYDFLNIIQSGDGFWVNAKSTFSATLPAVTTPVVNPEALAGISATLLTFQNLFATPPSPTNSTLAALVDESMLNGGRNKSQFLQGVTGVDGPNIGAQVLNVTLVNPADSGAVPNDATHQWFTFDLTPFDGPGSAWLAVKNASGQWLLAGDQRQFSFDVEAEAIKHVAVGGATSYDSHIHPSLQNVPTSVTKLVLTGSGVVPATGIPLFTTATGRIYPKTCGLNGTITECIDPAAASVGTLFTVKSYTTTGGMTVPAYAYTNQLKRAPLPNPSTAGYPTITSITGPLAVGSIVTVNWTLVNGTYAMDIDGSAWDANGLLFSNVGPSLLPTDTSAQLLVPNFTGTPTGASIWLSVRDASGNRLAVDNQPQLQP